VTIALPARAKLNLDLRVTGTRPDGMHELRTHMVAVELHDLVAAERSSGDRIELIMSGDAELDVETNTVTRAAHALQEAVGHALPSRIWLHKRIPAGSGLGGASSDAAVALRALKAVHGLTVDLAPVAARVGADVSFFLTGGQALVEGVGERITPEPAQETWFAIAWPGVELSTALVYRAWDVVGGDGVNELRRAAARVNPSIDRFAESLGEGWQMTGSGSAFFSTHADKAAAEAAAGRVDCWTAVTRSVGAWA
jgi:4-diphosphocytidyl-2-C-methyl-D-erythritol kinase